MRLKKTVDVSPQETLQERVARIRGKSCTCGPNEACSECPDGMPDCTCEGYRTPTQHQFFCPWRDEYLRRRSRNDEGPAARIEVTYLDDPQVGDTLTDVGIRFTIVAVKDDGTAVCERVLNDASPETGPTHNLGGKGVSQG